MRRREHRHRVEVPAGAGVLGADAHLVVAPSGELAVKPSGLVLEGTGMTPASDPATGSFQVMNQTGACSTSACTGSPTPPAWIARCGSR